MSISVNLKNFWEDTITQMAKPVFEFSSDWM